MALGAFNILALSLLLLALVISSKGYCRNVWTEVICL